MLIRYSSGLSVRFRSSAMPEVARKLCAARNANGRRVGIPAVSTRTAHFSGLKRAKFRTASVHQAQRSHPAGASPASNEPLTHLDVVIHAGVHAANLVRQPSLVAGRP